MSQFDLGPQKDLIITIGKHAYRKQLVAGKGGNISVRLDENHYLVTAHNVCLGFLTDDDFLVMNTSGEKISGEKRPSTECPIHTAIYRETEAQAVVHVHPPYTNVMAANEIKLTPLTFESNLYLGGTPPIIFQNSPTITDTTPVIEALGLSNVIIIKKHGTIAVADTVHDAFFLTELLEETAKMTHLNLALQKDSHVKKVEEESGGEAVTRYEVLSQAHMDRLVELINNDEEAQRLGKKTALTTRYALTMMGSDVIYNMHYVDGRIVKVTNDDDADFVITGKRAQWIAVFNGLIDPFAATTQKKLRLIKGHIADLSKWYPPFYRIFALWKHAPVK